jgi:O-antigen/teichoic acid export membrane protein
LSKPSRPAVHVARGASAVIANKMINTLVSVLAFAIIARLVSREEMGVLGVLTLVASAGQLIAGLGVGSTATRFVASFEASGDKLNARRAGYGCLIINSLGSLAVAFGTYLLADTLASALLGSPLRGNLLRLLCLEIAAVGLNYSLVSILTGLKRFTELSLADTSTFIARQSLVVILLEFQWGLPGVALAWGIGDGLSSIFMLAYVRKFLGPPAGGFDLSKLLTFSTPLFFAEVANYVWYWFDRGLLVPLVSLAQFGAYNVAVTAYTLLSSLPKAISSTLFPFYSDLFKESAPEKTRGLENAVRTASRYVSFFTIPMSVGLAATSVPAVTLLAGNNYADAAIPLAILSIALALSCQLRALSQIFVVLGKTVTYALVTIASVVFPIILGVLAIEHFGISGASTARGLSMVIALLVSVLILRGLMRIRFDMRAYGSAWAGSLVMAVVVLALQVLHYNKYLLPFYVVSGAVVYVLVLRLLKAIQKDDVDLVSEFLGPRLAFLRKWLVIILNQKD